MLIIPGTSYKGPLPPLTPNEAALRDRLRTDVTELAGDIGERNMQHLDALAKAAAFITTRFHDAGITVREEPYTVGGKEVFNIEAEVKGTGRPEEIVIIGAHYDSVFGSPGANDNASGVAALLELARLYKGSKPVRTLRFVAFVNEEPPYFQSGKMGSLVYARKARARGDKIVAMLSLETIGYYSDSPKSQHYPPPLGSIYPDTANFIGFVSDIGSAGLLRRAIGTFRETTPFPSEGVAAPGFIVGMSWSDQWSFWQEGYRAIMITDTALFRYPHYHESTDTPEKVNYDRLARVVTGIRHVVEDLVNR